MALLLEHFYKRIDIIDSLKTEVKIDGVSGAKLGSTTPSSEAAATATVAAIAPTASAAVCNGQDLQRIPFNIVCIAPFGHRQWDQSRDQKADWNPQLDTLIQQEAKATQATLKTIAPLVDPISTIWKQDRSTTTPNVLSPYPFGLYYTVDNLLSVV